MLFSKLAFRLDTMLRVLRAAWWIRRHGGQRPVYLDIGARGSLPRRWHMAWLLGIVSPVFVEPDPEQARLLRKKYAGRAVYETGSPSPPCPTASTRRAGGGAGRASVPRTGLRQLPKCRAAQVPPPGAAASTASTAAATSPGEIGRMQRLPSPMQVVRRQSKQSVMR